MSGQGAQSQVAFSAAYAGDVSPNDVWETLKTQPQALLIDVRTQPEWAFVGEPDLTSLGKKLVRLSWRLYPSMATNEQFLQQLAAEAPAKDTPLYFICRSGGRSIDAAIAATAAGWKSCYNVLDGFEGDATVEGQRGQTNGWQASALPWRQN